MKTTVKKAITFLGCISLFTSFSFGQCKNILKKADLSAMQSYELCGNAKVAKMYSGDEASISQKVSSNKRYRLMTVAQNRLGMLNTIILSTTGDTLGVKIEGHEQRYLDLMVEKDQLVVIKIRVPEASTTNGINAYGCVAVILGEIENTELVSFD